MREDPERRHGHRETQRGRGSGDSPQAVVPPPAAGRELRPYRSPRLQRHGALQGLTAAAEGTVNDGAGGFFAFSGAAG